MKFPKSYGIAAITMLIGALVTFKIISVEQITESSTWIGGLIATAGAAIGSLRHAIAKGK